MLENILPIIATPGVPSLLRATALRWSWGGADLYSFDTLDIPPGVTWIGGGEGRGKTTLLRLLAGELITPASDLMLAGMHRPGSVGYSQRVFWMDPRTEVFDAISATQFFTEAAANYPSWNSQCLEHLIDTLGLQLHINKPLYMLSTGSKRKVWLAAALASGAVLTLLDEPFAALDKSSIRCVLDFLTETADHPSRAWVIADYQAPAGVPLAHTIDLGD